MVPAPLAPQALLEEQQRLRQRQQEQALAILQEQQRLRHIVMGTEQERQQQEALAVLQEQQRLRQDQERQQALAILSQERQERASQEEELFRAEHIDLNPEHRPLNAAMAQRIFQGWEQQHEADLEEDFNDLGPQNDIPSEDDLEYVDPAQHQLVEQLDPPLDDPLGPQDDMSSDDGLEYVDPAQQRPAEDLDPALPNHPAGLQNPAEQPPLELPIPPQLGPIQPVPRGRQPYLIEYPPHYLGPMTVICPHCQALHFDAEKLTKLDPQMMASLIKDAPDVDSIVSAQISYPIAQPELYQVVSTNMVHGPCGAAKPNAKLENIQQYRDRVFTNEDVYDYGLHLINDNLKNFGKTLQDFPNMPEPQQVWKMLLQEETDYDVEELKRRVDENKARFNGEQLGAFNEVMDSVDNNLGKMIFIHSAGGCGKTFVCNTLASAVRSNGDVALCVASSGIAALLLEGGRTAHSRFKIPIPALETSIANIKRRNELSQLLLETKVVIWDEVPMQHKNAIDSVDQGFRDILEKDVPFGGVTVVFGGDFRQTLPVIQQGLRQQMIAASLKRGRLWDQIQVHYLVQNIRLDQTPDNIAHAAWLLDVGAGKNLGPGETVQLPEIMICNDNSVTGLISSTYPHIDHHQDDQYYLDCTILCGKNSDVEDINSEVLQKCPGEEKILQSADSVISDDGNPNGLALYPMEYLNSLRASSLPLAKLALKIGVPVMLLRNLDTTKGLCNGTRIIVTHISTRVLRCRIISGDAKFAGSIVLIPRINMDVSEEDLPIPLHRRQFPVRLAFAMTINKSQGNPEWFTNHLMSIAGPCSIDIINGLQIISNIYQWTL
ncbi:ATP-dependent DNA helicase PIF1 [Termitomyces sp. T112]|nr:ATP-dependent DNA helicase PIF1 [Termitomyces sp. T112]